MLTDAEIPLTKGKTAIIDSEDFERVNKFKWYCSSNGYAVRIAVVDGKRTAIQMHRFIMNTPVGMETDHKDLDRLNNRKSNLRICTSSQNKANATRKSESGFRGVRSYGKTFQARFTHGEKNLHLGMFKTAKDAALAYNKKAIEVYGEFARLNNV